jgi:hypothetical protein
MLSLALVVAAVLASTTAAQAVDGADEGSNAAYRFVARVQIGAEPGRGCSGVLVAAQWILTEKACFATGTQLPATGVPAEATTVMVGRTDLSAAGGRTLPVTWLVPHPDRDVVLARLSARVTDVAPARVATAAPQSGDVLRALGFGRTHTEWVPDRLHGADVTVGSIGAATVAVTPVAEGTAAVCMGDAGGPTVRAAGDGVELVGVHHASGQLGCDGTTGGTADVVETRVDDLGSWVTANTSPTCGSVIGGVANEGGLGALLPDFSGDCAADIINQNVAGELHGWRGSGSLVTGVPVFPGASVKVGSGWAQTPMPRILLGDVNGDGRTDIIGQASDGRLLAWPSTGDFTAEGRLFVGAARVVGRGFTTSGVPRLLAADFNGDGRTDIVAGRPDGSLTVWASTGNLSADGLLIGGAGVQEPVGLTAAAYPRIFVSDLNGDGRADLIAQATDGKLWAYRSLGNLSADGALFAPRIAVGSGWTAANIPRILTGDFNGDGRGDIAAQRGDGRLSVWTSTGDLSGTGTVFAVAGVDTNPGFTVAAFPRLLTGDLDGDGRTDILADDTAGKLFAWQSSGDTSPTGTMFPGPAIVAGSGWTVSAYPRVF